jgi:hypothetical protein
MRFYPTLKACLVIAACLLSGVRVYAGSGVLFDSLRVEPQGILGSLRIRNLLDDQIIRGLRKGMTGAVEIRVQMWHEKSRWIKSIVFERYHRIKIDYDDWERKFRVTLKNDEIRMFDEPELIGYCHNLNDFLMVPAGQLTEGEEYRFMVSVTLKPMSMENMEELKRWISGEAEEFDPGNIRMSKSPLEKTGDWILGVVVNLSGFGDRIITGKSPVFSLVSNRLLLTEDL